MFLHCIHNHIFVYFCTVNHFYIIGLFLWLTCRDVCEHALGSETLVSVSRPPYRVLSARTPERVTSCCRRHERLCGSANCDGTARTNRAVSQSNPELFVGWESASQTVLSRAFPKAVHRGFYIELLSQMTVINFHVCYEKHVCCWSFCSPSLLCCAALCVGYKYEEKILLFRLNP